MSDHPYNLLRERWIPVRDEKGHTWDIAPREVTKMHPEHGTVPVALAAPRPDFNGALIQFLIGLVQTACPPETERDWRRWFRKPPEPEELEETFEPFMHAFNLYGAGPRFMQDFDALEAKPLPITNLLIDAPTGKTLDDNKGHFVKDMSDHSLSASRAAAALLTLQLNAPSGGQGHRTSLRGGGPLTTIVIGKTLWQTVWLNVLERPEFEALLGTPNELLALDDPLVLAKRAFPWLTPTRTSTGSECLSSTTTSHDVHPLQMYWATPRRIRLDELHKIGEEVAVSAYVTKNLGPNYSGSWTHPLTPYRTNKGGTTLSVKGSPDHFSYRHWLGLTVNDSSTGIRPARVVQVLHRRIAYKVVREELLEGSRSSSYLPIWTFGYDMNKMKARRWHESLVRFIVSPPELGSAFNRARFEQARAEVERLAAHLVAAADHIADTLRKSLAEALYPESGRRPKRATASSVVQDASTQFWRCTEPEFYSLLGWASSVLATDAEASLLTLRQEWLLELRRQALLELFDKVTQYGTFRGSDPRAVFQARRKLNFVASAHNKTMRHILGLPSPPRKKP